MADKTLDSLESFGAARGKKPSRVAACDLLPEDVQAALLTSSVGHRAALEWLHREGHTEITENQLVSWRYARYWKST